MPLQYGGLILQREGKVFFHQSGTFLRTGDFVCFQTAKPESWVGKTVVDLEVRQKYRINILAIQRGGKLEPLPGPGHCFQAHETMFILGDNRDMKKFLRLS